MALSGLVTELELEVSLLNPSQGISNLLKDVAMLHVTSMKF